MIKVGSSVRRVSNQSSDMSMFGLDQIHTVTEVNGNTIYLEGSSSWYYSDYFELVVCPTAPTNSIGKNGKTYPEERKSMVERMVNIKFPHKTISGKQNYMTLTEEEAINLYSDLKGTLGGLV